MENHEKELNKFEIEENPEDRVIKFINNLYFELPNTREKAAVGKHLLEISNMQIAKIYPPLESEGEMLILPGQVFALTGANGAGKSTFFKSFLEKGNLPEGLKHKPGLKIGYLPQENNFDDVANLTLEDFLEKMSNFVREMNDWDFDDDLFAKGESILFTEALQTKVGDLSGGEKTKLQMFILLLRKAELIFLDEPTNHIDQEGQALLTVLIKKLTQGGTSFVISSHNEDFLEKNSQNGVLKISQEGGKRRIKKEKIYKREGETKNKIKIPWFRDAILTGQVYSGGSANVLGQEMSLNPIKSGDKVILAGDNGSGKTTLLKFLADLNNGKVERSSRPVYMPQEWPKEIQNGTLKDFLQYLEVDEKVFRKVLAESGFLESRSKDFTLLSKFSNLSLGEQRLLWFLAISSRNDTSFLLLDEPTNHLDASLKTEILKAILDFQGAVLVVTHDQTLMNSILGKVPLPQRGFWLMKKGHGISCKSGGVDEYFDTMQRKAEQSIKQL